MVNVFAEYTIISVSLYMFYIYLFDGLAY